MKKNLFNFWNSIIEVLKDFSRFILSKYLLFVGVASVGSSYVFARWGAEITPYLSLPHTMTENIAAELSGVLFEFGILIVLFSSIFSADALRPYKAKIQRIQHARDVITISVLGSLEAWYNAASTTCLYSQEHSSEILIDVIERLDSSVKDLESLQDSLERINHHRLNNSIEETSHWLSVYSDLANELLDNLSGLPITREDYRKNLNLSDNSIANLLKSAKKQPRWLKTHLQKETTNRPLELLNIIESCQISRMES